MVLQWGLNGTYLAQNGRTMKCTIGTVDVLIRTFQSTFTDLISFSLKTVLFRWKKSNGMDTFWLLIICAVLIIEKLTADLRTEYKLIGNNGSAYEADARYLKLQCGHMYSRNIYAGVELRWVKNSCLGILSNWSTSIDNMPAEQFGYMIKTVVKDVYHPSVSKSITT